MEIKINKEIRDFNESIFFCKPVLNNLIFKSAPNSDSFLVELEVARLVVKNFEFCSLNMNSESELRPPLSFDFILLFKT